MVFITILFSILKAGFVFGALLRIATIIAEKVTESKKKHQLVSSLMNLEMMKPDDSLEDIKTKPIVKTYGPGKTGRMEHIICSTVAGILLVMVATCGIAYCVYCFYSLEWIS